MDWFTRIVGTVLVLLSIIDIYFTVLFPRGDQRSVLSIPLSRGLWWFFKAIVHQFRPSRKLYAFMGPTLLVAIVTTWVVLMLTGFALIQWPALGNGIQMETGVTPTDFTTALYYSGFSLSTLGTGDLIPQTGTYRLLMILQAMLGFSIFTMTLTFFTSVYSQLIQRNSFALSLNYRTAATADAAELLIGLSSGGNFDGSAKQTISSIAQQVLTLVEAQHKYAALGYFRFQEAHYALGRILFLVMDTATLIRSALDQESYASFVRSASVKEVTMGGQQCLLDLHKSFVPKSFSPASQASKQVWRKRFYQAVAKLNAAGIETNADVEEGADQYVAQRETWNSSVLALIEYLDYRWSEIAPVDEAEDWDY
jgi:hypothetical protein